MRRRIIATIALALLPAAARAAEGMPQLNFANPLVLSQVVWLAIIFLALYLLISRWGLPQVATVLATRESRIQSDLDGARAAKARADEAVRELTAASARARTEAQAAINHAADQAKQQAATQTEALNLRLEQELTAAEHRIEAARQAALGALRDVATETASVLVGRLTNREADQQAVGSAVGSVLAARGHL
jgi:F-type H+-transporting ATPase subunit b